jgi:hypothetical protein
MTIFESMMDSFIIYFSFWLGTSSESDAYDTEEELLFEEPL